MRNERRPIQEIGARLNICAWTVEAHRLNIKSKLGLGTAAEVIAYAARWASSQTGGGTPGSR